MNDCAQSLENNSDYEYLLDKINRLEETVDVILLSMTRGVGASEELYAVLDRKVELARRRVERRQETEKVKTEYWKLKMRQAELESDHPELKV